MPSLFDLSECKNFFNPLAIHERLAKINEEMMAQDKADGIEHPQTLYDDTVVKCVECDYGFGMETDPDVLHIKAIIGTKLPRACFEKRISKET